MKMAKYSEAQKRAQLKYMAEKTEQIRLRTAKGTKEIWRAAAERQGMSMTAYVLETVRERIERESAADADILSQVVQALPRPYTVTFHTLEQLPTGRTKLASGDAQKVVEASSEADAMVAFFKWLKERMQTEVAFEDATRIGMKRDDGVIEICEIVSVE